MRRCLWNRLKSNKTQVFSSWRTQSPGQISRKATAGKSISSASHSTTSKVFTSHKALMSFSLATWRFRCLRTTSKTKNGSPFSETYSGKITNPQPIKAKSARLTARTPPSNSSPLPRKSWTKSSTSPSTISSQKPSGKELASLAWKKITVKFWSSNQDHWPRHWRNWQQKSKARRSRCLSCCWKSERKQFWITCSS